MVVGRIISRVTVSTMASTGYRAMIALWSSRRPNEAGRRPLASHFRLLELGGGNRPVEGGTQHLAPAIHCLLGSVERPVPIEEGVAGAIVAIELVHLATLLELGLVLVHLLGARRAVVIAEYAEQRAAQVLGHVDRRDRRLGIEL